MLITNDLDVSCLLSKCACIIIALFLAMLCAVICSTALKVNAVFSNMSHFYQRTFLFEKTKSEVNE